MRKILAVLLLASSVFSGGLAHAEDATCSGKFFNPFTEICWSCVFPISLGGRPILGKEQEDNDSTSADGGALCGCLNPPRAGVKSSFFEPVRLVESVRTPYCFPTLGGLKIDPGVEAPRGAQTKRGEARSVTSFYQVHWYTSPLLFWLEILLDDFCLERGTFDLAYFTELDPAWNDSELTFLLNPDAVLFANPLAQAACAADCVASTLGFAVSEMYWCAGCQGSMFPLNGMVTSHVGGVQASALLTQRMTAKLHRELLIWSGSGERGSCGFYPEPMLNKRNYKMQIVHPRPWTEKIDGRCCNPFGRSSVLWGSGKEYPYKGEDFSYQLFRKRDCCAARAANTQ